MAPSAIETFRVGAIAVELDHLIGRQPRVLMQVVDVLRDDVAELALSREPEQGTVAAARSGAADRVMNMEVAPPCGQAHFGGVQEVGEPDGLVFRPHAARRPEIGNPAFGRDAGAGEADDPLRRGHQRLQLTQATLVGFHDDPVSLLAKGMWR